MNKVIYASIGLCVAIMLVNAQYVERCHFLWNGNYLGCANTDADAAKEIVYVSHSSALGTYYLRVIDGSTGVEEWNLGPWNTIWSSSFGDNNGNISSQLIDADNDGRFEILFCGQPTASDTARFYLYCYGGGVVKDGPPQGNIYQGIHLEQNYPNPASSFTTINYSLNQEKLVELKIYDATGRLIRTLSEGKKEPGSYTVNWDGRDDKGVKLSNGSYFYQLEIDGQRQTKKMLLVK